jgi:hypothetical protein
MPATRVLPAINVRDIIWAWHMGFTFVKHVVGVVSCEPAVKGDDVPPVATAAVLCVKASGSASGAGLPELLMPDCAAVKLHFAQQFPCWD